MFTLLINRVSIGNNNQTNPKSYVVNKIKVAVETRPDICKQLSGRKLHVVKALQVCHYSSDVPNICTWQNEFQSQQGRVRSISISFLPDGGWARSGFDSRTMRDNARLGIGEGASTVYIRVREAKRD